MHYSGYSTCNFCAIQANLCAIQANLCDVQANLCAIQAKQNAIQANRTQRICPAVRHLHTAKKTQTDRD